METEYQGTGMDYGYNATYVDDFCNQYHPDTDGIELYESTLPAYYFYNREKILNNIPFSKDKYRQFKELQESITILGLNADALFELLAFLYSQIEAISNKRMKIYKSKLDELNHFIADNYTELKITLQAGRKKVEIGSDFLEYFYPMFHGFKDANLNTCYQVKDQFTLRRCSYMMIKNLDLALKPYININKPTDIAYTNKERDFYLRILHLCGYLLGEIELVCFASSNSATFNKLMRDFEGETFTISYIHGE